MTSVATKTEWKQSRMNKFQEMSKYMAHTYIPNDDDDDYTSEREGVFSVTLTIFRLFHTHSSLHSFILSFVLYNSFISFFVLLKFILTSSMSDLHFRFECAQISSEKFVYKYNLYSICIRVRTHIHIIFFCEVKA